MRELKLKVKFFLISILLLMTQSGYAYGDLFSPEAEDTDLLVKYIIEPLGNGNISENAIAAVSSVMLAGIMVIGAILTIYNLVMGLTGTALQGEMMGKKFSTTYTAARSVVGVGMLVPMGINYGYSAIQKLMIWLAIQGVYLGDVAWEKFVDNSPLNTQVVMNKAVEIEMLNKVGLITLSNLCLDHFKMPDANQSGNSSAGNNWTSKSYITNNGEVLTATANNVSRLNERKSILAYEYSTKVIMGDQSNRSYKNFCGEYELKTQDIIRAGKAYENVGAVKGNTSESATFKDETWTSKIGTISNLAKVVNLDDLKNELNKKHQYLILQTIGVNGGTPATTIVQKAILDIIKNGEDSDGRAVAVAMKTVAENYYDQLKAEAESQVAKLSLKSEGFDIKEAMKKDGIASAGAWYWSIVSQGSNLSDLINSPPKINAIVPYMGLSSSAIDDKDGGNGRWRQELTREETSPVMVSKKYGENINKNLFEVGRIAVNEINKGYQLLGLSSNMYGSGGLTVQNGSYNYNQDNRGILQILTGENTSPIGQEDFQYQQEVNPVISIHNLGKKIIWWFEAVMNKTNLGTSGGGFSGVIVTFMISLLIPAAIMVWYIPMLPLILWLGSLIGWLTMLIQAIFGAPLWMLAHLTPDKESFIGRQGQGYMLVLSLCIRPILMVIGLVVSIQLLMPVGKLINAFFGFAASATLGGSGFMWLMGCMAIVAIYAMVLQNTVKKIFSLIHVIPDSLLQWFGGNDQKILGEYANGIEQGSQQGIQQVSGGLSSAALRMGGIGGSGGAPAKALSSGGAGGLSTNTSVAGGGQGGSGSPIEQLSQMFGAASDEVKARENGAENYSGSYGAFTALTNAAAQKAQGITTNENIQALGGSSSYGSEMRDAYNQNQRDQAMFNMLPAEERQAIRQAQLSGATAWADKNGSLHVIPTQDSVAMAQTSYNRLSQNPSSLSGLANHMEQAKYGERARVFDIRTGETHQSGTYAVQRERHTVNPFIRGEDNSKIFN